MPAKSNGQVIVNCADSNDIVCAKEGGVQEARVVASSEGQERNINSWREEGLRRSVWGRAGSKSLASTRRHGRDIKRLRDSVPVLDGVLFFVKRREGASTRPERREKAVLVEVGGVCLEKLSVGRKAQNDVTSGEVTSISVPGLVDEAYNVRANEGSGARVGRLAENVHENFIAVPESLGRIVVTRQTVWQGLLLRVLVLRGLPNNGGLSFQGISIV